jgi:hypothetical protein
MRWNLRDLTLDHRLKSRLARVGKARSRSRRCTGVRRSYGRVDSDQRFPRE